MVQRSMGTFQEHNEKLGAIFTRPVLINAMLEEQWDSITKGASAEEIQDFESARDKLSNYKELYKLFDYGSDLYMHMTLL